MRYLDMATVRDRCTTKPPHNRSRSGYGSKLPTACQLRIAGRWHRVYAICWGTGSTLFVVKGGERLFIATGELS